MPRPRNEKAKIEMVNVYAKSDCSREIKDKGEVRERQNWGGQEGSGLGKAIDRRLNFRVGDLKTLLGLRSVLVTGDIKCCGGSRRGWGDDGWSSMNSLTLRPGVGKSFPIQSERGSVSVRIRGNLVALDLCLV